jgi:transketolase C-terminal domain/subunit
LNSFFADNGLLDTQTHLYFPGDALQMEAIVNKIFFDKGLRFIFSTRSKTPYILKEGTEEKFFDPANGYQFVPGKDEIIIEAGKGREGQEVGYVVSYGDMLYRAYDAVLRLRQQGVAVGLINKPTLNIVDEDTITKIGKSSFVLVVESMSQKTGVRPRFSLFGHAV